MDSESFEFLQWVVATIFASIPLILSVRKASLEGKQTMISIMKSLEEAKHPESIKALEAEVAETIVKSANLLLESYRDALCESKQGQTKLELELKELRDLVNREISKREEAEKVVHRLLIGVGRLTTQLRELGIEPVWKPDELIGG